ncbi:MAG: hypothetical protein ACLGIR_12165 [Actinomycetes bacterium]
MDQPNELAGEVELSLDVTPPDLHDPVARHEVERSLAAIPGVLATRLVAGYDRPVDELHVVATTERGPKQVVRDVQTALFATHGLDIDHRVVSVVQLEGEDPIATDPRRVSIARVAVTQQGIRVKVLVSVLQGDDILEGEDEGPSSGAGRRRAVARASLAAVRRLLGEHRVVEVEGAEVTEVLGHPVALTLLHFHSATGSRTDVGSALVRGDEADAIARSVLDACNRSIATADD